MPSLRTVGTIGEAKALFKFAEYGINGYVPFNENTRIDLIIDPNGKLQRLQIKTSTMYEQGAVCFGLEHNGLYDDTQIDYFVLYDLVEDKLLMVHVNDKVVKGKTSVRFRYTPPKNNIVAKVQYAKDYDIDLVIKRDFGLDKLSIPYIKSIHLKNEEQSKLDNKSKLHVSKSPTKEELIKLFNEYGTVTNVSSILGVCRSTVVRWCKKVGINHRDYIILKELTKICPYCHKEFKTTDVNRIYCSVDCARHHYRDKIDVNEALRSRFVDKKSFRKIANRYHVGHMMISNLVRDHLKKNNGVYNPENP